jgi:hypothetical protein
MEKGICILHFGWVHKNEPNIDKKIILKLALKIYDNLKWHCIPSKEGFVEDGAVYRNDIFFNFTDATLLRRK